MNLDFITITLSKIQEFSNDVIYHIEKKYNSDEWIVNELDCHRYRYKNENQFIISTVDFQSFLDQFLSLQPSIIPSDKMGLDGTTYKLRVCIGTNKIEISCWGDDNEIKPLFDCVEKIIRS